MKEKVEEEVEKWTQLALRDDDPYEYWASQTDFTYLALVARWILSCPPSNADLERAFSGAGRGILKRRPRLDPETSDFLLYAHVTVQQGHWGDPFYQVRRKSHHLSP